ncbi:glutathione S-transferase T3 isoform X1 [Nasonia vitripennis]|uniref:glutathione transferase n=1 Tax=Nasonia vitripennis TaxID=7425 RepID=A0A7M7PX01_NASVI|nr:glutathione S-transferase T3 [Nasonia vitripennis]XP_031778333.1 glutathione S-transferase T3 isoform X1 [Nasonia vitripennis]XP_031778334.1 glutathione S-transferase T3 isoform X1 [Nasonia vitripennis]
MSLKLHYDLLSQPARALYIFLKSCDIPFESNVINLAKREHLQPGYEKINPLRKIPALEHNGFKLTESVAILRYLCREFKVDDHWYPKDSRAQARVDEYLTWQHLNARRPLTTYFRLKYLLPLITGKPTKADKLLELEGEMIESLDLFENIWLKDKPFLAGDKISIADLLGASEVEQPRYAGYDPRDDRPKLTAWLDRVSRETSPFYQEAHANLNEVANKYG